MLIMLMNYPTLNSSVWFIFLPIQASEVTTLWRDRNVCIIIIIIILMPWYLIPRYLDIVRSK